MTTTKIIKKSADKINKNPITNNPLKESITKTTKKSIVKTVKEPIEEKKEIFKPFLETGHVFNKEVSIDYYFTPETLIKNIKNLYHRYEIWFYKKFNKEVNYQDIIYG